MKLKYWRKDTSLIKVHSSINQTVGKQHISECLKKKKKSNYIVQAQKILTILNGNLWAWASDKSDSQKTWTKKPRSPSV